MKFFDRIREKELLDRLLAKEGKRMIVLYGRRRIGKTTLLKNSFGKAKYFFVDTRASETLLIDFSKQVFDGRFENWESFFRQLLANEKIIIIDEFQNFLRVDPSVFSILQKVWDDTESNALLVLCGSYTGMMKRIFLDSKEPLFGRSDYPIQLKPFDFPNTYGMLSEFGYTFEESVILYSIVGGIPKYLWYLEERKPLPELLKTFFFDDFAILKEEGKTLLVGEFGTEHPGYFAVLEAIGHFDREIAEIADRTGMPGTKAMKYISELSNHYDIVERVENSLSKGKRGSRYRIKDNFLGFWFKYVYSIQNVVEFNPESALNFTVENLNEIVGRKFEEIVKELLGVLYKNGTIPEMPDKVGKHWGKVPSEKGKAYEIDIVGENDDSITLVECKWRNRPASKRDVEDFLKKCEYIKDKRKKIPVFVSRSGFKKDVGNDVVKIDLALLESVVKKNRPIV